MYEPDPKIVKDYERYEQLRGGLKKYGRVPFYASLVLLAAMVGISGRHIINSAIQDMNEVDNRRNKIAIISSGTIKDGSAKQFERAGIFWSKDGLEFIVRNPQK